MTSAERTFRGQSAQERRAGRRERLLDAALDLIGTDGWATATMTAVCRRAGLTERYFYESFKDRDALYLALIDAIAAETETAVLGALQAAPADPRARLGAVVEALLRVLTDDPRKGRVALLEGLGSAALQERRREILLAFERLMRAQATNVFGPGGPSAERIELASVALVGAVGELLSRRLDGSLDVADDALVGHIVELAMWIAAEPRG